LAQSIGPEFKPQYHKKKKKKKKKKKERKEKQKAEREPTPDVGRNGRGMPGLSVGVLEESVICSISCCGCLKNENQLCLGVCPSKFPGDLVQMDRNPGLVGGCHPLHLDIFAPGGRFLRKQ
jgi:hypothetical protein